MILQRRALEEAGELKLLLDAVAAKNPFHHRITPDGHRMSVAMTNCGDFGWSTDSRGYQYSEGDNLTGHRWPAMPEQFSKLAKACAAEAGFKDFTPYACLINRYE